MPAAPKTTIKDLFNTRSTPYEKPADLAAAKTRFDKSLRSVNKLVEKVSDAVGLMADGREVEKLQTKELVSTLKQTLPVLGVVAAGLGEIQGTLVGVQALFGELDERYEEIERLRKRVDDCEDKAETAVEQASAPLIGEMNAAGVLQLLYGNPEFAKLVRDITGNARASTPTNAQSGPVGASSSSSPKKKEKAGRNKVLEAHAHHTVKLLVGMKTKLTGTHPEWKNDGLDPAVFPVPRGDGRQTVKITRPEGKVTFWRPDWKNVKKPEWAPFIDACVANVKNDWEEFNGDQPVPGRDTIVTAIYKYAETIRTKAGRAPQNSEAGGESRVTWSDRQALKTCVDQEKMWGKSILHDCQKRAVYRYLRQRCFAPSFYKADEPGTDARYPGVPDMERPANGDQEAEEIEVDAWQTYRRIVLGKEKADKAWEVVWPSWMFDEAIKAASVIDREFAVTQEGKQATWRNRWCGPRRFWPITDLKRDELAPPSANDSNVPDESDPRLWVIYRSMIRQDVRTKKEAQKPDVWARIYPDPIPSANDAAMKSLDEWLEEGENVAIRDTIGVYQSPSGATLNSFELKAAAIRFYKEDTGVTCT